MGWDNLFGNVVQHLLPRLDSDHFPTSSEGGESLTRGPSPFCFENMWLKEEGFKDLLRGWWHGLKFRGSSSYILAQKLKALKAILKVWNKDVFGKVETSKDLALNHVNYWDKQESWRALTAEEVEERQAAKEEFKK